MKNLLMQENFERRFQKVLQNNKGLDQDGNHQALKDEKPVNLQH